MQALAIDARTAAELLNTRAVQAAFLDGKGHLILALLGGEGLAIAAAAFAHLDSQGLDGRLLTATSHIPDALELEALRKAAATIPKPKPKARPKRKAVRRG
jgi:hypothetical protein